MSRRRYACGRHVNTCQHVSVYCFTLSRQASRHKGFFNPYNAERILYLNHGDQRFFFQFEIIINGWLFPIPLDTYVMGHYKYFNYFNYISSGTVFIYQNLRKCLIIVVCLVKAFFAVAAAPRDGGGVIWEGINNRGFGSGWFVRLGWGF